jgi:GH15 family glucan-1,4-alpha-glucosidase
MSIQDYKPISDYGIIGNLKSVALIARDGSIDWCCLPRMDSPSVFAAILDARQGGYFRIGPPGGGSGNQEYVEETNVLKTSFTMKGAVLTVTDFMPLEGVNLGDGGVNSRVSGSNAPLPMRTREISPPHGIFSRNQCAIPLQTGPRESISIS